jgi:metal-sulfur cluster biosynthetic enzyme
MRTCYDPEIPVNIVDLGLVYECDVTANEAGSRDVRISMTLTAPGCGMGDVLVADVREKVEVVPTVPGRRHPDFRSPWNQSMMSDAAKCRPG